MQIKTRKSHKKLVFGDSARFYLLFAQGCERMFGAIPFATITGSSYENTPKIKSIYRLLIVCSSAGVYVGVFRERRCKSNRKNGGYQIFASGFGIRIPFLINHILRRCSNPLFQ